MKCEDLDEFVQCYNPENRYQRTPKWLEKNPDSALARLRLRRAHNRDKASLEILLWLRDESLEESDNLPDPDVLAQEIVEDSRRFEQFCEISVVLGQQGSGIDKNN